MLFNTAMMLRNGCLASVFSLLCVFGYWGHAIDLEYISPEAKKALEFEFNKAEFSSNDFSSIKQKKWICDMYGVRSRLQVKRDVNLYQWNGNSNAGAQLVRTYRVENNMIIGNSGPIEDQLKLNSKGQLISQLSLTKPERQILAYSVCKSL